MTCVNTAQWQLAIDVIETIKEPVPSAQRKMPHRHLSGRPSCSSVAFCVVYLRLTPVVPVAALLRIYTR